MHRPHAPQATSLLRKLLQVLLCASVLLNGVGAASASVRVATMALEVAAPAAAQVADSDCHEAAGSAGHAAGMRMTHAAMPAAADDLHGQHDEQECLQFCMDICMQHCHALFGGHALPASAQPGTAPLASLDTGLQSLPRLPPIRPPIA